MKLYLFEKFINIYFEIGLNSKYIVRYFFFDINKDLLIFLFGCVNENIRKFFCIIYIDILKIEFL